MTGFEIPSKSLSSLDPQYIRMYLSGSGWRKTFSMENYDVYRNASDEEVHVPRRNTFSDYPTRMRELLTTLSEAEGRRIVDIFSDISLVNAADSIQYRISDGTSDGTISASLLDSIIDAHRSISAAAYMDLSDPKPYHASCMKGYNASKSMRIGQTGYGSYIIRFLYPFGDLSQMDVVDGAAAYPDPLIKEIPTRIVNSSR